MNRREAVGVLGLGVMLAGCGTHVAATPPTAHTAAAPVTTSTSSTSVAPSTTVTTLPAPATTIPATTTTVPTLDAQAVVVDVADNLDQAFGDTYQVTCSRPLKVGHSENCVAVSAATDGGPYVNINVGTQITVWTVLRGGSLTAKPVATGTINTPYSAG